MMKRALNLMISASNFLHCPAKFNANPNLRFFQLSSLTRPALRFYASQSDSSNFPQTKNQNNNGSTDVEDLTKEELRRRIDKFLEGDADAIPSIFEAILKRKLAGKHDESDDELMEEIRRNTPRASKEEEEEDEDEDDDDDDEEEEEMSDD